MEWYRKAFSDWNFFCRISISKNISGGDESKKSIAVDVAIITREKHAKLKFVTSNAIDAEKRQLPLSDLVLIINKTYVDYSKSLN